MERIKIDDGSKTYEIVNKDDRLIGTFSFNPSDTNIIKNYDEVVKALEAYFEEMQNETFTKEKFVAAQDEIVDKISVLVGEDASKSFFSICGPFTPMANGSLYIETVINAVGGIIETETKARMKKVESRMNKYLEGYEK